MKHATDRNLLYRQDTGKSRAIKETLEAMARRNQYHDRSGNLASSR